ncbi:MAG: hypothetical protein IJ668_11495 [Selenomonadaceae bacterium]|nr:hypothetical protein [Selenomonadaceae bacterium]MBR1581094.1 hypothetical protein [Selenomonadaceae bacterium]
MAIAALNARTMSEALRANSITGTLGGRVTEDTIARTNAAVTRDGIAVASEAMRPVMQQVSNLGSEPRGGNGMASAVTDQIVNDAVRVMGEIMQRDDTYIGTTPLGNNFNSTEFHEMNDTSSSWQERRTASSYSYFNIGQM